jgi:hypothetical protein
MSFEIKADGVDVLRLLAEVQRRVAERKDGLYTEDELRFIAERRLDGVLQGRDLRADLLDEFRARDAAWNYSFDQNTLYVSSRGGVGRALEALRRLLRPLQKLFWNPVPLIAALSRQSELNRFQTHLVHNLVLELSRLNLELAELRNRNLQLTGRLEALERREKTLEGLVAYRDDGGKDAAGRG